MLRAAPQIRSQRRARHGAARGAVDRDGVLGRHRDLTTHELGDGLLRHPHRRRQVLLAAAGNAEDRLLDQCGLGCHPDPITLIWVPVNTK